jgi:hypothetical protein
MSKVVLGYEWDPTFGDKPFQEDDLVAVISSKGDANDGKNDLESNAVEKFDDESETPSLTDSPNGSLHAVGTKKRSNSKKALLEKTEFVDLTKDRLT